jgi:hypothetical protein
MLNILQFTTYDVEQPDHGGKLRSHHLRRALRERFTVETLSFSWGRVDDLSRMAVTLDTARLKSAGLTGLLSDWGICTVLEADPVALDVIAQHVRAFAPGAILLEQPFLWPLVRQLKTAGVLGPEVKVIYSSHNLEAEMKRQFYAQLFRPEQARAYGDHVEALETETIARADVILAVSDADAASLLARAPHRPILVIANGHMRPEENDRSEAWRRRFEPYERNWVFVGSWHPPNIQGLRRLVEALDHGADGVRLWVLGGAGPGLLAERTFERSRAPRLEVLGVTSAEDIDAAILASSGVILPIWGGGGSNLKTAQALLSRKCVLASRFALRGFEHLAGEPGLFLAETPEELAGLAVSVRPEHHYERSAGVSALEWSNATRELPGFLQRHLNGAA